MNRASHPPASPHPVVAVLLLNLMLGLGVARAGPLDIGGGRQLLVDSRFLASARGVELVVHRPQKTGAPVLEADSPLHTSVGGYASVIHHDGVYHLWYPASTAIGGELGRNPPADPDEDYPSVHYLCYARSHDGMHWEKPSLGLARPHPNAETNIVLGFGAGGFADSAPPVGAVVVNPRAGPESRFLLPLLVTEPDDRLRLDLFGSADGIHWRRTHERVMTHVSARDQLDTQNVIRWDARAERFVAFVRRNLFFPWGRSRAIARAESETLARFPAADDAPVVFGWDEQDPWFDDPARGRVRLVDYYNSAVIKYPWADDAWFMFPSAYFHYEPGYLGEFPGATPKNAGPLDIRFAASSDGIRWERRDRRAFVRTGFAGDWDSRSLYLACGLVPGADEREMYLYYWGSNIPHGWTRSRVDLELLNRAGLGPRTPRSGLGRLVLRRDGLVSARAAYGGGEFTTPAVRFAGVELVLNVDTSAGGEVRVEILDELHASIPGFTLSESDRIHTSNEIDRRVTWRGRTDVSVLAGRPVRLRFVMRDADLYAFQFRKSSSR